MLQFSLILSLLLNFPVTNGLKVINTSYGKVRGVTVHNFVENSHENEFYVFKSIPFAKPPIGNLRFALPEEPLPWKGILDGSKYSAACMSSSATTSSPQFYISEDCLYINIFTSDRCLKNKCPVIVYYHGGAFNLDAATMFPDSFILERYVAQDIIFAISAFRLGVFGQLYFGPNNVLTENLVLFDVIQSLNFVHNEIHNFGGDPNQVTLMGHSSGGTLVDAMGFSSIVDPDMQLFQQMIVLSAHGYFEFYDLAVDNSFFIANRTGCWSGSDKTQANIPEILECMRKLDGMELLLLQRSIEETDKISFRGIIRGAPFMKLNGTIASLKENAPPRKLLYGVTEHEFRAPEYEDPYITGKFLDFDNAYEIEEYFEKERVERHMFGNDSDWVTGDTAAIFVSAATFCEAIVNNNGTAYLFETRQKPYSFHVSDMQYFIGIHREVYHFKDMDVLDTFYSKLLVNFTKFGEPSPVWDKFDPSEMNFFVLEVDTKEKIGPYMEKNFHEQERNIWMVDLMDYDRNLTKMKSQKSIITPSTLKISSSTEKSKFSSTEAMEKDEENKIENENKKEIQNKNGSILGQWWFYVVVVFLILTIILLFLQCRRNGTLEERTPLTA